MSDWFEAEQRIEDEVADDAVVRKLREQSGIGLITAATMRAEIAQFERFQTGKQLARFCGLSPRNASSGERQADAGLIKAGNQGLRAVLIDDHRDLDGARVGIRLVWGEAGARLGALHRHGGGLAKHRRGVAKWRVPRLGQQEDRLLG